MKEYLKNLIKNSLEKMNISKEISEIAIEIPNKRGFGDYSSNVALKFSKGSNMNSRELANEIVAGVLLFPYFAYSLRTIYELKSIVGNTLLLFRASIQYKIIAFVKEDKEEKRKAEEGVGIK